jgi:multiple sugar transport system permease protein
MYGFTMQVQRSNSGFHLLTKGVTYGVLVFWSAVCLFPLYWVAVTSFKDISIIDRAPTYLPFVDFAPSLDAWRFIFLDPNENLVSRAANSAFIGLGATLLTLLLGSMIVYGLTRLAPKNVSNSIMAFLFCSRALPPIVMVIPLYFLAQATHTRDTLFILVFVYTAINLPIAVWMLVPVFGSRATDQEEAATIDGASHLQIFFGVLLPMMRASMITVGLLVFLQCWNEYLFAVYLTADHALTIPPWALGQLSMKEAQIGGEADEWTHLSAATVVMAVPPLLFALFAQRSIGRTLAASTARKTDFPVRP